MNPGAHTNSCFPLSALIFAISFTIVLLPNSPACGWQQVGQMDDLLPSQLFVPPPRELVRPLVRARKAMQLQDYRSAVELLGQILASPLHGDYLQPVEGDPFRAVSIHNQAHRLLGQIPPQHRVDYELRYKVTARQMLEQAVGDGDFSQMARVSRHYFYTDAGYHATLLLGHHYLEMGQPVSAASCFSALVNDDYARQRYDPEVSVMLATCWLLTGNRVEAQATLEELAASQPGVRIRLPGREVSLFSKSEDAIAWLVDLIGNSTLAGYRSIDDWLMFRGDAERNASSGTGFPLPYARWYIPTVNEPMHERLAEAAFQKRLSTAAGLIPALQPIAAGDTIVVRSLDKMVGIDFRSGKRVWEFPAWDRDMLMEEDRQSERIRKNQTEDWHVDQRLWQDHLYGQIASNGRYVFVIDEPGYASPVNQQSILSRGIPIQDPLGGRRTNELKAIDLVRQGAFCWEAGGKTGGTVAELAGCFFLGAPLVLENELYILGELGGEIRLLVLQQDTGDLIWSQQIAAIDSAPPVTQDRLRRMAGATPSCSNGIIVCPTSATGIVAVDRSTRSLLWGVQYFGAQTGISRTRNRQALPITPSRSVDSTVTIADGRVVVMPMENDRILCFDLLTGKSLWQGTDTNDPQSRFGLRAEDALYIACIHQGKVIVVGQQNVRAMELETGAPVWQLPLKEYGQPSGRGFLTGNRYFFPTSESKIVELDLETGSLARSINTRRVLGNLICYKDEMISQGFDVVSIYPQAEPVRKYVAGYLAKSKAENSDIPSNILLWQAQLHAQDGKLTEAVATADLAFQTTGQRREKQLLMDLVLQLMETDYTTVREVADKYHDELRQYGRLKFEAALFGGLLKEGSVSEALTVLQKSGLRTREIDNLQNSQLDQYRNFENGALRLRLDSWLHKQLYDSLTGQDEALVESKLTEWARQSTPDMTPEQLATFVQLIGAPFIPLEQMLRLAEWHISQKEFTLGERVLQAMPLKADTGDASVRDYAARRQALRFRSLQDAGWHDRAREKAEELLVNRALAAIPDPWTGVKTTGKELAERFLKESDPKTSQAAWNYGLVESQLDPTPANRRFLIRTVAYPQLTMATGEIPDKIRLEVNFQDSTLVIRDSQGNVMGKVPYRDNPDSRVYYSPRMYHGTYSLHGNLLVFAYGYDLIGVDLNLLKAGRNALLWQKNLQRKLGGDNRLQFQTGYQARSINNHWGQNRHIIHGRDEPNPIGNFASNAFHVFCRVGNVIHCIDTQTGKLIWQRTNLDQSGWLIADDEHVALLQNNGTSGAAMYHTATIMSAATGEIIKHVDLADYAGKVLWHSRGLKLLLSSQTREQSLTLFDLVDEREVWTRQWPEQTMAVVRDPQTMVFVTLDGLLEYFDLDKGTVIFEQRLQDDLQCRTFSIMKMREQDLLMLGREESSAGERSEEQNVSIRAAVSGQIELFNGWIYSVDSKKGQLTWAKPVRVQHFSVPEEHPIDTPLLTLNRLVYPGIETSRGSHNVIEFLTLDLRDGRLVNEHRVRNWTLRSITVVASREDQTIVHTFNDRKLTLRLGQGEFPPAAPASLTNESTIPRSKAFAAGKQPYDARGRRQQLIRDIRERNQDE